MKVLPFLLLLLILSVPVPAFEAYVSGRVLHNGEPLQLSDFISIYPDDGTVDLHRSIPAPGTRPSLLSLIEIRRFLDPGAGPVVLVGKRPVYIPDALESERERKLYIELLTYLQHIFPGRDERLEIHTDDRLLSFYLHAAGPLQFEVGEIYPRMFDLYCTDGDGNTLFTTVEYARLQPVYMSKRYIPAGSKVQADSVQLKMVRTEHIAESSNLLTEINDPMFALRNIPAGVSLLEKYVSPREVVKNGTRITILVEKGLLTLKLSGRTLEKAEVGSEVRVRPTQGTKELVGILVEKDVVAIDY